MHHSYDSYNFLIQVVMKSNNQHRRSKPNLDYPYLSLPDIDEKDIDYKPKNNNAL